MEQLLHYVWKHKIFPLKELKTTTGQQVEVIDTGLANTDAGPGFFNAKLKLDGVLWIAISRYMKDLQTGSNTDIMQMPVTTLSFCI